jgi:hypothetical protein
MAPRAGSRFTFSLGILDAQGRRYLAEREPYRYYPHPDNTLYVVAQGETLFSIAGRAFAPLPRACGLWWAIADFQPDPILDPTLALVPGQQLVLPSLRVLTDVILGEARRREGQ